MCSYAHFCLTAAHRETPHSHQNTACQLRPRAGARYAGWERPRKCLAGISASVEFTTKFSYPTDLAVTSGAPVFTGNHVGRFWNSPGKAKWRESPAVLGPGPPHTGVALCVLPFPWALDGRRWPRRESSVWRRGNTADCVDSSQKTSPLPGEQ